jgi:hypothetical protein
MAYYSVKFKSIFKLTLWAMLMLTATLILRAAFTVRLVRKLCMSVIGYVVKD